MNEHELSLGLRAIHQERADVADVEAVRQHVLSAPIEEVPQQRSWLPRIKTRGFTMFAALKFIAAAAIVALFGGFLLAGVLTTPQGDEMAPAAVTDSPSPVTATSELLFELSVPRWALPDDVTALEAGGWILEAGTDVTGEPQASQANESMRNRAIMVTSGTFLVEPTTAALLWRAPGSTPEVTPAGQAVTLHPGEAIYLPAVPADEIDPERYLRVANPGAEDATGLTFHVHEGPTSSPFGGFPSGLRWGTWRGDLVGLLSANATEWTAADEALFRLTRHRGDRGATIESSPAPATAVYLIESGTVEFTMSGSHGEFTEVWRAGNKVSPLAVDGVKQTLTVVGDEAASFLELVAMPLGGQRTP